MYGEARYICTAALIPGSLSTRQKAYQYQLSYLVSHYCYSLIFLSLKINSYDNPHLGSDHTNELGAFFSTPTTANAKDTALFQSMREYWTSFVSKGQPVSSNGVAWEVRFLYLLQFFVSTHNVLTSFI